MRARARVDVSSTPQGTIPRLELTFQQLLRGMASRQLIRSIRTAPTPLQSAGTVPFGATRLYGGRPMRRRTSGKHAPLTSAVLACCRDPDALTNPRGASNAGRRGNPDSLLSWPGPEERRSLLFLGSCKLGKQCIVAMIRREQQPNKPSETLIPAQGKNR